jgi:hypothetical protein
LRPWAGRGAGKPGSLRRDAGHPPLGAQSAAGGAGAAKITRTALILVGRVLDETAFADSKLYDADHVHVLRPNVLRPKRRA